MTGKLIIFSAPSGSGKSTLINYLMGQDLNLAFSISATSRPPRGTERDGVEYFFLTPEEFRQRIANGEFLEYEEVYKDRFYGTLKAQEVIDDRIARAEYELTFAPRFDTIVVNDDLEKAKAEALARLKAFLHP